MIRLSELREEELKRLKSIRVTFHNNNLWSEEILGRYKEVFIKLDDLIEAIEKLK